MEDIITGERTELSHGENSHQEGYLAKIENGLEYEIITPNKDLEYLDYLNMSEALYILAEFFDVNSVVFSKDGKVFSAALGSSAETALEKAIDCEPTAITLSSVGFSKKIGLQEVKTLLSMKIKNIIAPSFDNEAKKYLSNKTEVNAIWIKSPLQELLGFSEKDIKVTPFGHLVQEQNLSKLTKTSFKVAGKVKPEQQQAEDAIFAWKVAKHLKSRGIVIAKDLSTKAVIQGGLDNSYCVERAIDKACENSKDSVLALDGSVDTKEVLNAVVQGRVALIIESGLSAKSTEFIKFCDKYSIALIKTGIENNRY